MCSYLLINVSYLAVLPAATIISSRALAVGKVTFSSVQSSPENKYTLSLFPPTPHI
jgi:hypothetical protein